MLSVALVEGAQGTLLAVGFEVRNPGSCFVESARILTLEFLPFRTAQANKVHVYAVSGTSIPDAPEVEFKDSRNPVYALAFTSDGALLAAGESGGKIQVFDVPGKSVRRRGPLALSSRVD